MGTLAIVNTTSVPNQELIDQLIASGAITEQERPDVVVINREALGITDEFDADQVVSSVNSFLESLDAAERVTPAQKRTCSRVKSFDLFDIMSQNLINTITWFQYDYADCPEDKDPDEYDLFIKSYGDGVFGFIELDGGQVNTSVSYPSLMDLPYDGYRETCEAVLAAKRDHINLRCLIVPFGGLYEQREVIN